MPDEISSKELRRKKTNHAVAHAGPAKKKKMELTWTHVEQK